ncbi:protein MNN4 [Anoplophora glabripennis]|uniref:protein MNN4 n=1 Tax=Anoplophora glabripennis TaxID=217634 RepID=UPI0008743B68|nr:protein MNN4 [Anoplophora glabripennis]
MTRKKSEKITIVPFYGGGKGQALQIVENKEGQVTTTIIKIPENYSENLEETINTAELENPPLPSKYELDEFGNYVRSIQSTALKVIKLQEAAKRNGKLSEEEEVIYKESMDSLNQSAKNLAKLQEETNPLDFEGREGLSAWFERRQTNKKDKDKNKRKEDEDKKKKEEDKKRKEEEDKKKAEENRKKEEQKIKEEERKKEEEKNKEDNRKKEEEKQEEEEDDDDDSITINLPPEDASVAEAKPVGLAVAGEGGVAASKPIATAVVGPGGLAIARPVGTAIAGVSPEQALIPIQAQQYIAGTKSKTTSSIANKQDSEFINRLISRYHQN